ncbi:MAG: SU10 major capsid protein, partial [Casimicrobium sp.]
MPAPANTFTSYGSRGNAEDVDKKIYNMSPQDTPFLSSLEGESIDARTPQWQEDSYDTPNKDNAMVEGDDFAGQPLTPTFMLRNTIQTFRKDIVTSGVQNAINKYGRGKGKDSEQRYQVEKKLKEIKMDMEAAMLSNNVGVVGSAPTASKMAGIELYSDLNVSHGATGVTPALTNDTLPTTAITDGTLRPLTEPIMLSALRTMWENGGTPRACYLTLGQKAVVNAFPGIADRRVDVKP